MAKLGIGERIKAAREKREMSQEMLAAFVNVKRETIVQWETETRQIKAWDLRRLVAELDVSADYLLGFIEQENQVITDICAATGLTQEAAIALRYMTPFERNVLNRLLSSEDGSEVIINIGLYLQANDYQFGQGKKVVTVQAGENHFDFTAEMLKSIPRDEMMRHLDAMCAHPPHD